MLYQRIVQVGCFITLLTASISGFSQTKVVVVPLLGDDAPAIPAPKSVFLTQGIYQGDFGGPLEADLICQEEADAVNSLVQGKTFKAWVSGPRLSDYAGERPIFTKSTGPYQLVGGSELWGSYDDLISSNPAVPISKSADGMTLPSETQMRVWTGLNNDGTYRASNAHCGGLNPDIGEYWTLTNVASTYFLGGFGRWDSTDEWSDGASVACTALARLYCFEQ